MVSRGWVFLSVILVACAVPAGREVQPFKPAQLIKTDIDRVAEEHRWTFYASLRVLAEKLYRRNPQEWRKGGWQQGEAALQRLFGSRHNWRFPELQGRFGSEAIQAALREDYGDDRVFAFIAGLGGMVHEAFDGKDEFDVSDDLDPQKLYNAARNLEIAAWKLAQGRRGDGSLYLLSNEAGPPANLSFEREFGKMIGNLDLLSGLIADKANRTVVKIIQNMATAVFLPIAAAK